jgi:hypothetical protein
MAVRFDLLYGEPGSGKTLALIQLIKALYEETGKKARVFVGDGSKIMYSSSGLIEAGVVDLIDFGIRDNPFTVCQQITEGMVPTDYEDPASPMRRLTIEEIKSTGITIYEGAAVMGQFMLGNSKGGLAQRAAAGEVLGQDVNVRFTDTDGYTFGGNAGSHYNIGQRQLHANIMRSKQFPGMVVWTTHERIDDGETGGAFAKGSTAEKTRINEKCIGPELVGKALTRSISRDFGNTLHFQQASKKVAGPTDPVSGKTTFVEKMDYRIYTRDHYDPDGIVTLKYKAVCRAIDPTKVKDFYSSTEPGKALLEFYKELALANKL